MEHLRLSLAAPLQLIAQRNERSSGELSRFLAKQIWSQQDRQCILSALAHLLLDKECTLLIGRQFRPILLDLLERNAEVIKSGGQINHDLHERLCVALSKLIGDHPDVMPFALRYFKDTSPVFQRLFLESSDTSTVRYERRRMKLRDLMEAAYKFLQKEPSVFKELWDWSVCVPLLRSHDTLVRWLLEESRIQNIECALVLANPDTVFWNKEKELQYTQGELVSADLSAKVVAVCGVVLPRQQFGPRENETILNHFVLVESTCRSLQNLAMAVASQNAVLLEGPVGCGKTSLVEFLAAVTGRTKPPHVLKVQLGDQTDSKTLLGMYRCTDIPGEFVWQPGTLTQAVSKGHWILLEDIDYAPLDVISVLIPLLENGELLIPGRSDCIKVAPGFQLFATRRVFNHGGSWYRQQTGHAALLDKYWTKVQLNNMPKAELKEILQRSYPKLAAIIDHLLDIYIQLTGDKHLAKNSIASQENITDNTSHMAETKRPSLEGRELSLRDLLNWCNRIAYNFSSSSPSTALNIFHEALDCFTAMLSKQGNRLKMAEVIGSKLNISKHKAEYYCQLYKPEIVIREQEVSVGRIQLFRKQTHALLGQRKKQTFAPTRPSSVLIEQLAVCVDRGEPVLLVGETGTGKTSTVQYLAHITGHHLRVINMNQQSDIADLLGGYKPVDNKQIWLPLRESFEELFAQTFSRKQNRTFLGHIQTCYAQKRWHDLLKLMQHVYKSAVSKEAKENASGSPLKEKWEQLGIRLNHAHQQMKMTENALIFAFVEGTLAQAVKQGEWVLLDEINLAAAETLECLSGLLEGLSGSLVLLDRGDTEPLVRHPNFRLFACMNPATDVGKRNLPPGIRNRFTELYIEELQNEGDLQILIMDYLRGLNMSKNIVEGIINFYLSVRKECETKLVDGRGHRPHYSLRTLCRALRFASSNPCSNMQRSLYEPLPEPKGGKLIKVEGYWISVGDEEPTVDETYVLTPSVKLNLRDIVRVVSAGTYPVLIQGDTSIGKTSLIRWLAAASGNHCVRINNHEHTDIQEYIGCYTSDESGKLIFKEGVLIDAMRKGYWIILDELNLAPTDVLEALNRLLDDNRELFITETQETVKAHPRFMLFATQNPPGLYGGRKVLSRAFRNRFVELHFDELPSGELETILHKRCQLPPSYCSKLVKVMLELQSYRRVSSVFAGKHGFITLRDLFRWAERYRLAEQTEEDYDWLQHLANDGFMLLAGRVRKQEEVDVIQTVIEKHFKRKLHPHCLFSKESVKKQMARAAAWKSVMDDKFGHIVWTQGMRRLAVLVGRALEFGEPILLVGDTGCGKTTICQIFAALANQKLYSVNCHLHMETSDFLGGLRPIRQRSKDKEFDSSRLFEWMDGALVLAMREEGYFLMDEISLADDSVLERLNSVLETERTLVLAEKGSEDSDVELLTAGEKFRILATMNPGGDFGKKELSPALRNRFTEIWCPQSNSREDLIQIVKHNLHPGLFLTRAKQKGIDIAELMIDFIEWLTSQEFGHQCILSIRDVLSWIDFMNTMAEDGLSDSSEEHQPFHISPVASFVHAACLVYIDGIGSGPLYQKNNVSDYALNAGTTAMNAQRLLRALQLNKPILLEGSPGVGKTSLVAALAKASGNCLVRINLSEQTDVTDLFGTDLPVEGGKGGEFAWRDGPLLAALKAGHWIVLDEVYVDALSAADMEYIGNTLFPAIGKKNIAKMVEFNNKIDQEIMVEKKWGHKGGPWEFNLRDLFRWCQLMLIDQSPGSYDPGQHIFLIYGERMRTKADKEKVVCLFKNIFGQNINPYMGTRQFHITPYNVQVGFSILSRANYVPPPGRNLSLLHHSLQPLESIMKCVHMGWMVILVGPAAAGKTSLVQLLAYLTGHQLKTMAMNSSMDTTELLGGFEQVDLVRPWKSLLEKVENVVSTLLRDSLLLTAICPDDAEVVLRAWSNFVLNFKTKSLGEGNKDVIIEVMNKLEGVLGLVQRVNHKISSYSKSEFSRLIEEFRHFKLQVLQFVNNKSHGTFEWADGMLVQALQSGDWLLMDNVNFCSPSVLDRLNALLEPGGVLTMSERGVIDGVTPAVTPHPNFRLFLSMDPMHGEISRAMRNRGIEIYIPGDGDENSLDPHDMKLLLNGLGLSGNSICDALVAVHTEAKTSIAGSSYSLSSLMHVATLIVQQLHRGFDLAKSFYRACWEVYVCSQRSQDNQQLMLDLIVKQVSALTSNEARDVSLLALGLWPDSASSALLSAEDSLLSTVQSDGQVLAYCLHRLNLQNSRTLPFTIHDFEKILKSPNPDGLKFSAVETDASWADDMEVLSVAVKLFIEKATNQDWTLRVGWLNQLKKNLPQVPDSVYTQLEAGAASLNNFYFSPLSGGISNVIKMLQPNMTDEHVIPMDPRWNMQCLDIISNSVDFDTEVEHSDQLLILLKSLSNRAILFLDREKKNYVERSLINTKKSRNSALRASLDFHKDPGNHISLPHPIIANLAAFFEIWDAFVLHWVKSTQLAVSDEKLYEVLRCLLWRDRFWAISDTVAVDSSGLALLSLHWHWVAKHLISNAPQLLSGHEQHKLSKDLQSVSQHIRACLASPADISANVKKLQKSLGKPLPFKDKEVLESAAQLRKLSEALNILELRATTGDDQWQKEIHILETVATKWEIKKVMLQAQDQVLRANQLNDVNSDELYTLVNVLHSKLKEDGALVEPLQTKYAEGRQVDSALLTWLGNRVQLWPAMEYLAMLWQYKLTADCIAEADLQRKNYNLLLLPISALFPVLCPLHAIHPDVATTILSSVPDQVSSEEVSLLWSELVSAALVSFWRSTVTTDPERWLAWQPTPLEGKKQPTSLMEPPVKGVGILSRAVFSKCLAEILTNSSKWSQWDVTGLPVLSASNVTLGEWLERARQLWEVSAVLWTNLAFSSMAEFRSTDCRLQCAVLHRQLVALKGLIPAQQQELYLQNCDKLSSKDPATFQYLCKTLRDVAAQDVLPEELLCLCLACLQQLFEQEGGPRPEAGRRGSLWVNLGLLQIHLWLPQTQFDPAVKNEYKLKYAEEELHRLECEWKTHTVSTQLQTGKDLEDETISSHSHPHIRMLCQRIQKLKDEIANLSRKRAYRPQVPSYHSLYQDVYQFASSVAQISKVQDLVARLLQVLHGDKPQSLQAVQNVLREEAVWQESHHQFRKRLAEDYAAFPDVVAPLQAAILQVQHGLRLVASEVHRTALSTFVCPAKLGTVVASLLSFPSVDSTFPTYLSHANALCSVNSLDVLHGLKRVSLKYCADGSDSEQRMCLTQEQLLVNALLYLRCHVIINEWDEQERLAQEEEEQKNSLFRYRTKSHGTGLTEEEEEERDFRRTFPLHEKDFEDITTQASLEGEMKTEDGLEDEAVPEKPLLSHHSVRTVMMVHQQLCLNFARSLWYQQSPPSHQAKHRLSAFLSCYQTGTSLVAHFYPLIGSEMNDNLHGSQLLASTILQNTLFEEGASELSLQHEGPYDFYHHPNIQQVRQCQPVLENLTKEVKVLLQEWPEHPALVQDWEETASQAVSLRKHLDSVTQLIIQWRKLELNCWSVSLDNAMQHHTEKSMKHWFSIYQMIEKYRQEEEAKKNEDMLCNVLWNLYNYYKQFSECIQARLTELRQPIEKGLKEFVKISKWNDVSFWAVKQSVEKTHRVLFKFIKKFEAALSEPCRSALVETAKEQLVSLHKQEVSENQETKIQSLNDMLRKKLTARTDAAQAAHLEEFQRDAFHPESLQGRLPKLTKRMKKICTTLVKNSSFLDLIENLDHFTGDIISIAQELKNMSVNPAADKEKQKSEVKHLLVQKQRALTELFKNLATTVEDFVGKYHTRIKLPVLSLQEIGLGTIERCKGFTAHLMKMLVKQRGSLTALTEQWIILSNLLSCIQEIDGRLNASNEYEVAFPPQDGVQQWTDRLQYLAMQCVVILEQLSWFIECCPKGQPLNSAGTEVQAEETELNPATVPKTGSGLIPSELQYLTPVAPDQLPSGCKMRKHDPLCEQLASRVKEMLAAVKAVKANVDRIRQLSCETLFHSWKSFEVCSSGIECLLKISTQLQDIESLFVLPEMEISQAVPQMALIRSLVYIQGEINESVDDFAIWRTQLFSSISHCGDGDQRSDDGFVELFSEQVELAIQAILNAVQCLVERKKGKEEAETSMKEDGEESSTDRLVSGHLTKFLDEDVCADLSSLHVQKIISVISELLERLKSYGEDYTAYKCKLFNQSCHLLVRLMPILHKYSNLLFFYLIIALVTHRSTGKLLSVLANIFTELAQKGFCLPKELMEDDAGEGATEFHDYEGGGIGEGEGKKDVSDQIENEDQVEDTYQQGQEKENEDPESKPDIKGEDNAIEMSEDFEGKTYDGEQVKQEDDERSDEDEDLEKQMGNLGDAEADKLDERLWGDDDDDDDDESDSEDNIKETGPGMDEREYDENEVDPYYGKQEKQPEAESLDLPDNLNLENGEEDGEDKDEEEGENPFETKETTMDTDESKMNEEDSEDVTENGQDSEQAEKASSEDKGEEDKMEEETEVEENTEHPTENIGEDEEKSPAEDEKESTEEKRERGIPDHDQGLHPQEEEVDNPDKDEELPEPLERMEHESDGQAGEETLQSDVAVELAGTASEKDQAKESFKRKPGEADNERSTGDHNQHVQKRLRTVEASSEAEQTPVQSEHSVEEADVFEHIKQGSEAYDAQTYDVASEEQQKMTLPLDEDNEEPISEDAAMETDAQNLEDLKPVEKLNPEKKMSAASKSGPDEAELEVQVLNPEDDKERGTEKAPSEVKPERNKDSTIHTAYQFLRDPTFQEKAASEMWQRYLLLTAPLSQQLCEQLRLILEPTQAAKLKGDYRTGKRLNMRKVIPYIASQFRKDKIWLRRTKPSKRQYQICLALDDSASMIDNHSKQLAYESLAVIGNALTLLEVGQLAVCSFGETVQLLHPFHEQFNAQSGTRILQLCKFEQKKTKIAQFLESSTNMFAAAQQLSQNMTPETAQLLLIVSDGRGLFLEGKERVTAAVQSVQNANIFVIFVVLDNPNSRDSILDIKVPIFKGPGELPEIRSYMEEFPFPFYIILRDVNALPETLSDALRQWFELFLRRQQVLQLYRKILRAIRQVPHEVDRHYLRDWARTEFKRNKDATEEDAIRMMIMQGNMQLQELERTLKLAKS
ncbi:hypothetical protein lerEdw1_001254 [Lerista edwardsae]|nr:hypothetical protein lerEdw1_001254 [Lerista edwardsae]